jgi:hypothetical protein
MLQQVVPSTLEKNARGKISKKVKTKKVYQINGKI